MKLFYILVTLNNRIQQNKDNIPEKVYVKIKQKQKKRLFKFKQEN